MQGWLAPQCPKVRGYGILRCVRDVFAVSGCVRRHGAGCIVEITLNRGHPLASDLAHPLSTILRPQQIAITVGEI